MTVNILIGDARARLAELPDESMHCVVTSPPYFGLRDYGTASWEGGDADCQHSVGGQVQDNKAPGAIMSGMRPGADASRCRKCGAARIDKQIGLEDTPAAFVAVMVEVFREVRRVLRKDGTLWCNLGDSFSDKQMLGIPWRVAFALQADGWYLRQDIIWSKPNPMPESVTDRCTKAHEYLFLLSKGPRYHYDAEAIREGDDVYTRKAGGYNFHGDQMVGGKKPFQGKGGFADSDITTIGRNKRSVWEVTTAPFAEAHFATFPPALIEPCIKAGCPENCCAKCGAPVVQGTEPTGHINKREPAHVPNNTLTKTDSTGWAPVSRASGHWMLSCSCDAGLTRGTVLDPFGGAGTTGLVADRLGRNAILIELNPEYAALAERRIKGDCPLFTDVSSRPSGGAEPSELED